MRSVPTPVVPFTLTKRNPVGIDVAAVGGAAEGDVLEGDGRGVGRAGAGRGRGRPAAAGVAAGGKQSGRGELAEVGQEGTVGVERRVVVAAGGEKGVADRVGVVDGDRPLRAEDALHAVRAEARDARAGRGELAERERLVVALRLVGRGGRGRVETGEGEGVVRCEAHVQDARGDAEVVDRRHGGRAEAVVGDGAQHLPAARDRQDRADAAVAEDRPDGPAVGADEDVAGEENVVAAEGDDCRPAVGVVDDAVQGRVELEQHRLGPDVEAAAGGDEQRVVRPGRQVADGQVGVEVAGQRAAGVAHERAVGVVKLEVAVRPERLAGEGDFAVAALGEGAEAAEFGDAVAAAEAGVEAEVGRELDERVAGLEVRLVGAECADVPAADGGDETRDASPVRPAQGRRRRVRRAVEDARVDRAVGLELGDERKRRRRRRVDARPAGRRGERIVRRNPVTADHERAAVRGRHALVDARPVEARHRERRPAVVAEGRPRRRAVVDG